MPNSSALPQFANTNESGVSSLASYPFQRENILKTDFVFSFLQINRLLMKIAVHSEKNENSNNF